MFSLGNSLGMVSFLFQVPSKIPSWLKINKIYYPDFIVPDPKVSIS